jgi:hypothetical protein
MLVLCRYWYFVHLIAVFRGNGHFSAKEERFARKASGVLAGGETICGGGDDAPGGTGIGPKRPGY